MGTTTIHASAVHAVAEGAAPERTSAHAPHGRIIAAPRTKVHATTVNRTDCGVRAAKPFIYRFFLGLRRPRLTVLGTEFAGVVEAVGGAVTSFQVGDRVFGFNGSSFGAHAEYLAIPEQGLLATMPADLTFEEAAPSTEGSQYALSSITAEKVRRGQDVLVYGATGAIGSAAVQLLKQLGANVTAVCDTLFGRKRVRFPLPRRADRELAAQLKGLIEAGAFKPVIDRRYPLDQIVEAYRYDESGRKIGNVVLSVEPPDRDGAGGGGGRA